MQEMLSVEQYLVDFQVLLWADDTGITAQWWHSDDGIMSSSWPFQQHLAKSWITGKSRISFCSQCSYGSLGMWNTPKTERWDWKGGESSYNQNCSQKIPSHRSLLSCLGHLHSDTHWLVWGYCRLAQTAHNFRDRILIENLKKCSISVARGSVGLLLESILFFCLGFTPS